MPFLHRRIAIVALIIAAVTGAVATAANVAPAAQPNWLSATGTKTSGTVTFDGHAWSALSMGASTARIEIRTQATAAQFSTLKRKVRIGPGRVVRLTVPAGQVFYITPLATGNLHFTVRGVQMFASISGSGTVLLAGRGKYHTDAHPAPRAWPKLPVTIVGIYTVAPPTHTARTHSLRTIGTP
jgi:hypothetical protein